MTMAVSVKKIIIAFIFHNIRICSSIIKPRKAYAHYTRPENELKAHIKSKRPEATGPHPGYNLFVISTSFTKDTINTTPGHH